MSVLATLVQVEAWLFLGAVATIILHRFASGGIDIGDAQLSRLQLLTAMIAAAAYYLSLVVTNTDTTRLPEFPIAGVVALGGSNLLYLGNKLWGRWSDLTSTNHST